MRKNIFWSWPPKNLKVTSQCFYKIIQLSLLHPHPQSKLKPQLQSLLLSQEQHQPQSMLQPQFLAWKINPKIAPTLNNPPRQRKLMETFLQPKRERMKPQTLEQKDPVVTCLISQIAKKISICSWTN